jgi:endonuclease I
MAKLDNKKLRVVIYNKYGGRCAYCGCDLNRASFAIDHITPIHRGMTNKDMEWYKLNRGTNDVNNLNPCCKSCNSSKSSFTLEKWRDEISKKYDRLMKYDPTFRLLNRFNLCKRVDKVIEFYFEKYERVNRV